MIVLEDILSISIIKNNQIKDIEIELYNIKPKNKKDIGKYVKRKYNNIESWKLIPDS